MYFDAAEKLFFLTLYFFEYNKDSLRIKKPFLLFLYNTQIFAIRNKMFVGFHSQ